MKTDERYLLLMLFIYGIIAIKKKKKKIPCCVGVHLPCGRQCVRIKLVDRILQTV